MSYIRKETKEQTYQGFLKIDKISMPNKIHKKEDVNIVLQGNHELVLSWTTNRKLSMEPFIDDRGFEAVRIKLSRKDD